MILPQILFWLPNLNKVILFGGRSGSCVDQVIKKLIVAHLGLQKQVQDAWFDNQLTGVKKESFYWPTKTIAHNKGFLRKWKQIRHVEKVYLVKTNSAVSFSSLMQRWSILETGHCVCLEVVSHLSSVSPCKKKKLQKAKKLFKVSLFSLSKIRLLIFLGKPNFCQFILVFKHDLR